jgi:Ca2+-binding EF-hand superfamily protein
MAVRALDMDRDGRINRAEFKHLRSLLALPKLHEMGLAKETFVQWHGSGDDRHDEHTFAHADRDSSGRLSRNEYDTFRSHNDL